MATVARVTVPGKPPRNPIAVGAKMRRGGAMKHKNAPKGGQRNEQRDMLDEASEDAGCYICGGPVPPGHAFVCSKKCADEAEAWAKFFDS